MGFLTFEQLEQFYGVPIPLEYEDRQGNYLVISIGAGLMMAAMDAIPQARWSVDMGTVPKDSRFADWLQCAERLVDGIIVVGWYSISSPQPMRDAISALQYPEKVFTYVQGCSCVNLGEGDFEYLTSLGVGQACKTLEELKDKVQEAAGSSTSNMPSLPDTGNCSISLAPDNTQLQN